MKIIETKKFAEKKEPDFKTLEKNKIPLTSEERKKVMDAGATWNHGPNGEPSPAVWKSEVDGKTWYICNTHRCHAIRPTLKGSISSYDFIETTSSSKKKIKHKKKEDKCLHSLDIHCDGVDDGW